MRSFLPAVSVLLRYSPLFFLLAAPCSLADIYRYTDGDGKTVLSRQGVPSEYIGKGYQVLNEQGRVIKTVPRAPSPEEREQLQKQKQAEKAQRDKDERLLRLYSTVDDVERTKQNKLREFDALIEQTQDELAPLSEKLAVLYKQLAGTRRSGEAAPSGQLTEEINQLKNKQRGLQKQIVQYRAGRREAEEGFNAERARLAELLEQRS